MLYKFKSKDTGDVIMLEPNGRRVLEIIGKTPGPQGIILPAQMAAAIQALKAAMDAEDAHRTGHEDDEHPTAEVLTLRQRSMPFVDMLERSLKEGHEVVWGV